MNKHTPQEWADWTGCYVNQDKNGLWYLHKHKPELMLEEGYWNPQKGANDFEMNIFSILISAPADHNWTHLYEPRLSGTDTHEERMENARITQEPRTNPASLCSHQSEVHTHKEYKVVCYTYENSLNEAITSMMSEGWKPQGSIAMVYLGEIYSPPIMFAQAMVRGL